MLMKRPAASLLALVVVFVLLGTGRAQTIRVGVTSKVLDNLPLLLGKEKGLFRQEGVEPEIVVLGSSTRIFPALVGGSIEVFDSTLFVVFLGIEKGEKVEIVGAATQYAPFHLVTKPEIKQVKDIRGKRVGSTGVGSGQYFSLVEFMERNGLKFPGDYTFITIGGTPEIWRALQAGTVDAGVLLSPFHILAQRKGFNVLAELYRDVQYPLTGIAVRSAWARQNDDLLLRYLKGYVRAMAFTYAHREEAEEVAVKVIRLPPELAKRGWEEYSRIHQWQRDLVLSPESVKTMLGFLVKAGELKFPGDPGRYVNPDYVNRANAEVKPR